MVKIGLGIVAAFVLGWFAFPQVRTNIAALAPFAIILICPLAMLFGMRGHGNHGDARSHGGCCGGDGKKDEPKRIDDQSAHTH